MFQFWKSIILTALIVVPVTYTDKVVSFLQSKDLGDKTLVLIVAGVLLLIILSIIYIPSMKRVKVKEQETLHSNNANNQY